LNYDDYVGSTDGTMLKEYVDMGKYGGKRIGDDLAIDIEAEENED